MLRPLGKFVCVQNPTVDLPRLRSLTDTWGGYRLLDQLDAHRPDLSRSLTVRTVAASDKLFVENASEVWTETLSPTMTERQAAYLYNLSALIADRLKVAGVKLRGEAAGNRADNDGNDLGDSSFIANLLHLLFRLRFRLFQVLVNRTLQVLEAIKRHWHEYQQQRRKLGNIWFAEWPDGRRPLSTTWPWNIRPSLVVLWGVCWMFYTYRGMPAQQDVGQGYQDHQDDHEEYPYPRPPWQAQPGE